jgi:hypothetical protein
MNIICAHPYFLEKNKHLEKNFSAEFSDFLETNHFPEISSLPEITLNIHISENMQKKIAAFLKSSFSAKYINDIFLEKNKNLKIPKMIIFDTFEQEYLDFSFQNIKIKVADFDFFRIEIEALLDFLGIIIEDRESYPGGKQKIAVQLLEILVAKKESGFPIFIF